MKNLYLVLNISEKASLNEIKKVYRSLVKKYHPDNNISNEASDQKFKEIKEAYEILSDEKLRKKHDEQLKVKYKAKENLNYKNKVKKDIKSENRFEQFFGFNTKTEEKFKKDKTTNKIDTENIFNSYFSKK